MQYWKTRDWKLQDWKMQDMEYKYKFHNPHRRTRNRHQFQTTVHVGWAAININYHGLHREGKTGNHPCTDVASPTSTSLRQRQRPQRHMRPKCAKSAYWFHVTAQHWGRAATPVSVLHVQIRLEEWVSIVSHAKTWFCECSPETATCSMFLAESVSELCFQLILKER